MTNTKLKKWTKENYVRYFSHYSGLWTSFNAWYNEEFKEGTDRENINKIRSLNNNHDLVIAFQKICHHKDPNLEPLLSYIRAGDKQMLGYAQYTFNNAVVRFIKFSWTNSIIKKKLWCGNGSDKPIVSRHSSRIATIYVDSDIFKKAYSKLREFEYNHMAEEDRSVQDVLEEFGIKSIGSVFYSDPGLDNDPRSAHAKYMKDFVEENFGELLRGRTNEHKGLFVDVIEMLYAVRNSCVHGEFDEPNSMETNDLLQAAFECLHLLILEYLKEEKSKLHF